MVFDAGDRIGQLCLIRDIGRNGVRFAAAVRDGSERGGESDFRPVEAADIGTGLGEPDCDRLADAAGGTRDDRRSGRRARTFPSRWE